MDGCLVLMEMRHGFSLIIMFWFVLCPSQSVLCEVTHSITRIFVGSWNMGMGIVNPIRVYVAVAVYVDS